MHPKGAEKPSWPYPHIVPGMFAAGNGQWSKKINGRRMNFGPWADPKAAMERFELQGKPLLMGEESEDRIRPGDVTVEALCQLFVTAKAGQVRTGDLSARMYDDYKRTCKVMVEVLGAKSLVLLLKPADFTRLHGKLGPSATRRANQVIWVRTVFKWGYESDMLDRPVKYGPGFKRPAARGMRKHKNKRGRGLLYTPDQVQALVSKSKPLMRALVLLAINAGFGNTDCAAIQLEDVDLDKGIFHAERHKTGFERTATLWPETVQAMRDWLAIRPRSKLRNFFLTPTGEPLVRVDANPDPEHPDGLHVVKVDAVAEMFKEPAAACGIKGKGFYALRHTFRTVAEGGAFRERTIDRIMGHIQEGIGTEYIHDFSPDRLRAVTDYVRAWYLKTRSEPAAASPADALPAGTPPAAA